MSCVVASLAQVDEHRATRFELAFGACASWSADRLLALWLVGRSLEAFRKLLVVRLRSWHTDATCEIWPASK